MGTPVELTGEFTSEELSIEPYTTDKWEDVAIETESGVLVPLDHGAAEGWAFTEPGRFEEGHQLCSEMGMVFRAPQTAYENYQMTLAKRNAGVSQVYINYAVMDATGNENQDWRQLESGEKLSINRNLSAIVNTL